MIFVGRAFVGEFVGLELLDEKQCEVRLGSIRIGVLSERLSTTMPIGEQA